MKAVRLIGVFLLVLGLAACDGSNRAPAWNTVEAGTVVAIKAFGRHYDLVATESDGYTATWDVRWGEHTVSTQKDYRGIMTVSVSEGDDRLYNKFNTEDVDRLFPLEIGKETTVSGERYIDEQQPIPFWTHISVRGETEIETKDGTFPVFVIDISTEYETAGESIRALRTMWYSPQHGFRLKAKFESGEERFDVRVISVETPDEWTPSRPPARRSLGTVMI